MEKKTTRFSQQGADVINLFVVNVNPACDRYYKNTTQRKACDDLIRIHGWDRVKFLVEEVVPKTNKVAYLPTITTPLQLLDKHASLEANLHKMKEKQDTKKPKIIT